jgi:ribosomal protein L7/L12
MTDDDLRKARFALIEAEGPVIQDTQETAAAEVVKEKDAFDVKLKAVDAKAKIKVIKEVRAITGLGLKEVLAYLTNIFTEFTN